MLTYPRTQDCLSSVSTNTVVTLLPYTPKPDLPANTTVIFTLLPTVLGIPFIYPAVHDRESPVSIEEVDQTRSYITEQFPKLVEGWKYGSGAARFKGQKTRVLPGGLESTYCRTHIFICSSLLQVLLKG